MTREEAIEILKYIIPIPHRGDGKSTSHLLQTNALAMAIKALEQQPNEDCVSRKAILNKKELIELPDGQSFYSIDPENIKNMPPVTPIQKWIPVSEKLPYPWDERYLVSLAWGGIGVMEYKSTGFHNYGSFTPVPIESIIAWMPLPEPWKGERNEHLIDRQAVIDKDTNVPSKDSIDRQAVINAIANTCFWLSSDNWEELIKCINSIPPVNPQEPKTGHWILTDDDLVYCSECEDSYYARPIDASWYYCPHCGAKMESEV